jgi:hypothetical protein
MARLGAREERPALNKQLAARDDQQRVRFLLLSCHHVPQLSEWHQQPCVASVRTRPPARSPTVCGRARAPRPAAACALGGGHGEIGDGKAGCVLHARFVCCVWMPGVVLRVARRVSCCTLHVAHYIVRCTSHAAGELLHVRCQVSAWSYSGVGRVEEQRQEHEVLQRAR